MNRRLKRAESRLNMDREQIVVIITSYGDKGGFDLSGPPEQWLTYPQALDNAPAQNGLIVLHEAGEIAARRAAAGQNHGVVRQ